MTLHADGTATCDRCGGDVGNAGIDQCAIIADLAPDGSVINQHLCRSKGCHRRVLTKAALKHYVDQQTAADPNVDPITTDPGAAT